MKRWRARRRQCELSSGVSAALFCRTAHWDFPRTAQELVFQVWHSSSTFCSSLLCAYTESAKLAHTLRAIHAVPDCATTNSKGPRSFLRACRPYPPHMWEWRLVLLALPTYSVGITNLSRCFCLCQRAFGYSHVVPCFHRNSITACRPLVPLESLLAAYVQYFANIAGLHLSVGSALSCQSPVVRSERSSTD